jgi:mRNA degradation ribonuclease J1/J2
MSSLQSDRFTIKSIRASELLLSYIKSYHRIKDFTFTKKSKKKREEIKNELREEIKKELREEIKNELREEIKKELREEIKKELREEIKKELKERPYPCFMK